MTKVIRPDTTLPVFASEAPTGEVKIFGTATDSTSIEDLLTNQNAKDGWLSGGVDANGYPAGSWFNALGHTLSYVTSYVLQQGIPEYSPNQEYYIGSVTSYNGRFIKSKTGEDGSPNLGNTPTLGSNWDSLFDIINVKDFGAIGDGVTDDSTAVQNAINYFNSQGGLLYAPRGKYLISNITIEDVTIFGDHVGANDIPYDDDGTVFVITDTVNPAFNVKRGGSFKGCNFFYPNQDGSTVNPIVYPALFKFDTVSTVTNFTLNECVLINPYIALDISGGSSAHGRINLINTQAYAVANFLSLDEVLDDIHLENFILTPGVYQDVALTGAAYLRKWTQANATAIKLTGNVDGFSVSNGSIFGYSQAIQSDGDIDLINFNQVSFDQTPVVWNKLGGEIRNMVMSNIDVFAVNRDTPSLNVPTFSFNGTSSKVEAVFTGLQVAEAQGVIFQVTDDGDSIIRVSDSILKEWASATGIVGNSPAVNIGNSNAKIRLDSLEAFTSYVNDSLINGVNFNEISVRNCDISDSDQPIILANGNVATLVGNTTTGTVTGSVTIGTVGRVVNTANNYDIP